MTLNTQIILQALKTIPDFSSDRDVVAAGRISAVTVRGGKVGFLITVDPVEKNEGEHLRRACEETLRSLPGVEDITIILTAHNAEPIPPQPGGPYNAPRERAQWNLTPLPHVKRIIAVASGKGGVGKSTVTINLAHALMQKGERVGILDADIYGPSIPRMLGLQNHGQPEIKDGKMLPPAAHGITCMSMAFVTGDQAAILRGPMISKSLQQLLRATAWGSEGAPLDTLLVDMPPGTGDVHLSLCQQVPLAGAIIVTTPQEVAVMDARKCAVMFQKVDVPILGVVENMSGGVFGVGGGMRLAQECNVPLLATVPLDAAFCEASDKGKIVENVSNHVFAILAQKL